MYAVELTPYGNARGDPCVYRRLLTIYPHATNEKRTQGNGFLIFDLEIEGQNVESGKKNFKRKKRGGFVRERSEAECLTYLLCLLCVAQNAIQAGARDFQDSRRSPLIAPGVLKHLLHQHTLYLVYRGMFHWYAQDKGLTRAS